MRKPRGNDSSPPGPRGSGEAGLYTVPRLEELAADPSKAGVLDARTARIIAAKALAVFATSLYRLFEAETDDGDLGGPPAWRDGPANVSRTSPEFDDVTTVKEIARVIGKERRWITRNAANLPFVIRILRKNYVCSRIAFRRWLASRPRSLKRP
jgi:hypothetical protein